MTQKSRPKDAAASHSIPPTPMAPTLTLPYPGMLNKKPYPPVLYAKGMPMWNLRWRRSTTCPFLTSGTRRSPPTAHQSVCFWSDQLPCPRPIDQLVLVAGHCDK